MQGKDVKKKFREAIAERQKQLSRSDSKSDSASISELFDPKSIQNYLPTSRKTLPKIRAFSPKNLFKPNFAALWYDRLHGHLLRVAQFYASERGQHKNAAHVRQIASKLGVFPSRTVELFVFTMAGRNLITKSVISLI